MAHALAGGSAAQRAALAQQARWAEEGEAEEGEAEEGEAEEGEAEEGEADGSPYRALAAHLRMLTARLEGGD